jgi:hypothetical protein
MFGTYFLTILTALSSLTIQMSGEMPVLTNQDVQSLGMVCDGSFQSDDRGGICISKSGGAMVLDRVHNSMDVILDGSTTTYIFSTTPPTDSDFYVIDEEVYRNP